MQVLPGGSLTLAGMLINMQQPSDTILPPDMKKPLNITFYDQVSVFESCSLSGQKPRQQCFVLCLS